MDEDSLKRRKILVVDDEERMVRFIRLNLEHDGFVVIEAFNGKQALQRLRDATPDLILLDVMMPDLNGFEVLELVNAHPAVIFVTAYDEYALKAFEVHAVDYLLKPFSKERFAEALLRAKERIGKKERPDLSRLAAEAQG